jgi:hypothetical protein
VFLPGAFRARASFTRLYLYAWLALCGGLLPFSAHAGAWLQPEGKGLLISQFFMSESDTVTDIHGQKRDQEPYRQWGQSLYGEWGVHQQVTLGASMNLIHAQQHQIATGNDGHASALTDVNLFARYGILREGAHRLSVQFATQLPRTHFNTQELALGNPNAEYELALQYGHSTSIAWDAGHAWNAFIDAHLGYRMRASTPDDQWRMMLTAGVSPWEEWQFLIQSFATLRTDRSTPPAGVGAGFTQSNADDYDQLRLQASAVWKLSEAWALQAGYFHDVYGRNFGQAQGVLFGVWREF